jgi:hypothetical protein
MAKKTFSLTLLAALGEQLRTLPRVEKQAQEKSRVESIRDLAADIRAAQRNGYSLAQIADSLTSGGLAISEATLKNYLGKARPNTKKKAMAGNAGALSRSTQ